MDNIPLISVIIPVYNGAATIGECLRSVFSSDYENCEVIVVDDYYSSDRTLDIAGEYPCQAISLPAHAGTSAARNQGASTSRGEILFFLDSDILAEPDALSRIAATFAARPGISALFCSYQKDTVPQNFTSVYKNLLHHYTHQTSHERAATFCGGFGAIKREVFFQIGGFNENHYSLEDMDLGYRLHQSGHQIFLDKTIQLTHCKRYTLFSLVESDVVNRAVPWTRLMLDKGIDRNDLNTKTSNALSVPLAFLMLLALPFLFFFDETVYLFPLLLLPFLFLNRYFYRFIYREKGFFFFIRAVVLNWFSYLYSGVGLLLGILAFLRERRIRSPS